MPSSENYFRHLHATVKARLNELNTLDAAVGDGDHGTTLVRGLTGAVEAASGFRARRFMRASGGASGTLFGLVLHEIERHIDDNSDLPGGLARALARICDLGDVRLGDKSMVDALGPAVDVLVSGKSLADAVDAAAKGREATRSMRARRGRARHIEGAGVGHLDPGAVSVVMILEALLAETTR